MKVPWMVSLHGGHSGEFCDHGKGSLREIIEAAVACGYHTFGVTEHAPRIEPRFLYSEEIAMGWDVDKILHDFERYACTVDTLSQEFADRITILKGFEAEVVPANRYADVMNNLRKKFGFEYVVGSVHWVDEVIIDYKKDEFDQAVRLHGGIEPLAVRYYELIEEMVRALRPEVVGHLDLIRKFANPDNALDTPPIRKAAELALSVIRDCNCILDVNTAALTKGLGSPYPAPWLVRTAANLGIGFCLGDDSHSPKGVGVGIPEAREYLLENGVETLTVLARSEGSLVRKSVPLK